MARISIPEAVKPGFMLISDLTDNEINTLLNVLNNVKTSDELEKIEEILKEDFGNNSRLLLQTVASFSGLLEKEESDTPREVAKNLTLSFTEINKEDLTNEKKIKLEENLTLLLSNVKSLRKNINSRNSAYDNESILRTSKLITDLRILFHDDLGEKNRDAVILHKLHIEYQQNFERKEIYFTLDLKDLNKLKSEIEKAIEKDQVIREDFKESLNIIL